MRGQISPFDGSGGPGPVFRGQVPPSTAVTGNATINWSEDTDTHNMFGGGTGIVTIPAGFGGLYLIALAWKPSTAVGVAMFVKVGGSVVAVTPGSNAVAFTGMGASLILPLAAGNQLTVEASNSFTTTGDVAYNTWLHMAWLRP